MNKIGVWAQAGLGSTIIGGLVVAGVLWGVSLVPSDFPLDVLGALAGFAVALGLIAVSIANKSWRGRTWDLLFGLRLLTKKKREKSVARGYVQRSFEQHIKDIEMKDQAEKSDIKAKEFLANFLKKSSAELPWLPPREPRWVLSRVDWQTDRKRRFQFQNLVPGSVALGVRVERHSSEVAFNWKDAGDWPDLSGEAHGEFAITLTDCGAYDGFVLRLSWLDENHSKNSEDFRVEPSETDPNHPWNKDL